MTTPTTRHSSVLVQEARRAMNLAQAEFATTIGSSHRTISRWESGDTTPAPFQLCNIARLVYPLDRELATEMAFAGNARIEELGVVPPPAPPPPPPAPPPSPGTRATPRHFVAAVVHEAAMALDVSPRTVRPAVLAAVRCMRELALDAETAEQGLLELEKATQKEKKPGTARASRASPQRARS